MTTDSSSSAATRERSFSRGSSRRSARTPGRRVSGHVAADDGAGDEHEDQQRQNHQRTSTTPSNMDVGSLMPAASSRSDIFGPHAGGAEPSDDVARPGPTPSFSKTKISCIVMMSPSMPVISEMLVTLRVPSL